MKLHEIEDKVDDVAIAKIISSYGSEDPLDGDEVEELVAVIRAKLNFHQGNITEAEYDIALGMIECEDCGNTFKEEDIRAYKHEPSIKLCDDCHDQRMEEE